MDPRISALALAGFAITAGGCLGEPSASVAPNDLSSGHTVVANALICFAGPTSSATPADWWSAFSGYDDAYDDTLFYEDAWHTVRVEDRIHFSADGRTRAAKVLAAAIQSALGMA